eukprot:GGOE01018097.1.p1 GENE.GGOE01018097.1~~GGOE01018097.1.p1  ORF type:complete len:602 (+),score=184.47 GGOE01018097.1:23-1807(+)
MPPAENLQVEIRVRPLNRRETDQGARVSWHLEPDCIYEVIPSSGRRANVFTFDRIHAPDVSTVDVYRGSARAIVLDTVAGFNATIFVYGQTSAGKTYTMAGNDEHPRGLVHLAVQDLWDHTRHSLDWDYSIKVSFLEIYNEKERDLLDPTNTKLSLVQSFDGVACVGLTTVVVQSVVEIFQLHAKGKVNRETGSTGMNSTSSRSHAIFQVHLESRPKGCPGNDRVRCSLLNLVDLAGSERHKDTCTEGQRKLEGSMINRSLLTLQKVIKALADCGGDRSKSPHIPLRESKLTRILDNSLGGDAKTLIICTVTPADLHRSETLSCLQFAKLAKMIKNKPQVNEKVSDKLLLQQYQKEIEVLKSQVAQLTQSSSKKRPRTEKENEPPKNTPSEPTAEDVARWKAKLTNMDQMIALYSKRFLDLKEHSEKKKSRRISWLDADTLFELQDRGVEVYDQEPRQWPSVPVKGHIRVPCRGGRISCPSRFAERESTAPPPGAAPRTEPIAVAADGAPQGSGLRSRELLERMVEELEAELAYCKEAKHRADEEVQRMLQQRLEFLDVLEQQKTATRDAIQAAFTASRKERMDFLQAFNSTLW